MCIYNECLVRPRNIHKNYYYYYYFGACCEIFAIFYNVVEVECLEVEREAKKRDGRMTRGKQKIEAQRRNAEKNQKPKGSQLEARVVALKVSCPICKVVFPLLLLHPPFDPSSLC